MFYQKKDLLEKVATMKRFQCSQLDKELKAQTGITKDQYNFFKIKWMLIIAIEKMILRKAILK